MHARRAAAAVVSAAAVLLAGGCGRADDNSEEASPSASLTAAPSATASGSAHPRATATDAPSAESASAPAASHGTGFTPGVTVSEEKVTVRMELVDLRPTEMPEPVVELAKGQTFELVVRSDKPYEIHFHGYDKIMSGGGGEHGYSFVADLTGSFVVELHTDDRDLFSLRVS